MSDSRMIFDEVRCFDCRVVIPKDEAAARIRICDNALVKEIGEEAVWFCEDCYAERQADQWDCVSRES